MDDPQTKLKPWTTLSSEIVFDTPWFKIEKQNLETPTGATPTFYIHNTHDSVMCVCVTKDRRVLLEKQYRPAIQKVSVDYPAGRLEEDDKSIEEAMLRELKEETGYKTNSFKKIAIIDKDPGFSTTRMHIYLAQGAIPGKDNPEESESIVSKLMPAQEVLNMVYSGELSCAYCVSATLYAFKELGWLQSNL
ncbi:MAG TPA: NUDIX hydrolase [Candidatus Saccharimonadales bacterium]|nr:NUDIX hydrolase [Candidatus Saccharimonadales bacterium]